MRYPEIRELSCIIGYNTSNGNLLLPVLDPTNGVGVTLGVGTYTFPLGGEKAGPMVEAVIHALSASWPLGIVGTLTIEATNYPKTIKSTDVGPPDLTDWDTSGKWVQWNPTVGGANYTNASGTGTWTNYSLGIASGVGAAIANLQDIGFLRMRAKIVTSVGGFFRIMNHSKLGA